ncbi:Spo0E like sporulation regulatory protein [Mesobacillus persicus]|uniref:Spo0E like sporulation regulatory protein n=1 Tax=Mesobacillus persicus TaxID=930146 RepID=A0A1H7VQB8_9BACI|nr:aspartyl-phosphate phosphatase Spo0E family protein [Mesobacillus persicus]SEM11370.1 Spo0E like sporulation regulatory protein [Mesobacillus persicus]
MVNNHVNLERSIEVKRLEMTHTASITGISSHETLKISQDLDKLITLAMKNNLEQYPI